MSLRKNLWLGGFLLVCFALLTVLSVSLTGGLGWGRQDWTVYFGRQAAVKEGSEVFTSGTKIGIVKSVELVSDREELVAGRYVRAVLSLEEGLPVWEGAEVQVVARGVLGGVAIELFRGDPTGRRIAPDQPLRGRMAPGVFDDLAGILQENRENIEEATTDLAKILGRIEQGEGTVGRLIREDELYQDLKRIAGRVDGMFADLQSPKSSLGRLMREPEVYEDVRATTARLREIAEGVTQGKGTVGRLFTDEELANKVDATITRLSNMAKDIDEGRGTLGLLIRDETLHQDLLAGVQSLRRFTERIEKGKGTFTRLLDDDTVYENLRILTENLKVVSDDVRAGKGTLGLLLKDEGVYNELQRMLESFRETGEVARENAPLGSLVSFTSLFFNVLN